MTLVPILWDPLEAINLWMAGDFVNALLLPFTATLGSWFYALLLITIMAASWLKTRSIFMVGFLSGIYSVVMVAVLPLSFFPVLYWAMAFSIMVVLYRAFVGRE